jgi:hypothetical protein
VLVCKNGKFYQRASQAPGPALALAKGLLADPAWPSREEDPFLDLPLQDAKAWGHAPQRDDGLYRWTVEARTARAFPGAPGGGRTAFPVFSASFTTRPDHLEVEFAPGVGITGFTYEHHGAVARTQVRLVSMRP